MIRFRTLSFVMPLTAAGLLAGCSGGDGETVSSSEDDLHLPSWVVPQSGELSCGDKQTSKISPQERGHGYALSAKGGRTLHFELRAEHAGTAQKTVALFDAKTKRRVAVSRGDGRVSLDFTPPTDRDYVVAAYSNRASLEADYALRELCLVPGMGELEPGQSTFESLDRDFAGGPMRLGLEAARGGVAHAPQGRSGPVEEADVYKMDGKNLFYLNTYRGFLSMDLSNPKAPRVVGRLPVYGYPVEMFVQNGVAYALLRDVLELRQVDGRFKFEKKQTSQLVAIDVSNPAQPKLLEKIDIDGDLREGLARKVGSTIYVVTQEHGYRWLRGDAKSDAAWVTSFDVSNPADMKRVQSMKIFEGGGEQESGEGESRSRWFSGVTISATSNALMVAENWYTHASVWGSGYQCGQSQSMQEAVVSIVDISDPNGRIRVHTKFSTYGALGDQFKQAYKVDPATKKATYYGIFARQEWSSQNCQGQSHVENTLEAWDVSNGGAPSRLSKLSFGKPNETVRGSAFDVDRGVVFAITAERVDPLYAISIANPSQMKVLSAVDGLSGDMSLFRFIGDRKFLLAIGRDNSNECTGFDSPATGFGAKVHASILDVEDATKVRLVQRKCVTVNDAAFVGSEVNWNLDQAHKLIGLHEGGLVNLVAVPVHYTRKVPTASGWDAYKSETATGLLSWDLTKYDRTKDEKNQTVLDNASTIVHPAGQVKRSVVFSHPGVQVRRKLMSLSNTHLSIADIENVKQPVMDAVVEIAPYKDGVYAFGQHVVELVQPRSDYGWDDGGVAELRVKARSGDVDAAPVLASFTAPGVERAMKFGEDTLVLFQRKSGNVGGRYTTELFATVYDLSAPTAPRKVTTVKLPVDYLGYARFGGGFGGYFQPYESDASDMIETPDGLVFLTSTWNGSATVRKLVALRLGASVTVTERVLGAADDTTLLGLTAEEGTRSFLLSTKQSIGTKSFEGQSFKTVKYGAQRFTWYGTNVYPTSGVVAVPGKIAKSFRSQGKSMLVVHDKVFDLQKSGGFLESTRLSTVELGYGRSTVSAVAPQWAMDLRELVLDGGRLYANLAERSTYGWGGPILPWARGAIRMPMRTAGNELRIFQVNASTLAERFAGELGLDSLSLMGARDGKLFVSLEGQGVLVADTYDAARPSARDFVRTLGYASSLEIAGTEAYVPAGHYGIYTVPMFGPRALAR